MPLLKNPARLWPSLLALASAVAGEPKALVVTGEPKAPAVVAQPKAPAPLTVEEVDRAQDRCLSVVQAKIAKVIAAPSAEGLENLWNTIHHLKVSEFSPFAPGFRYHLGEPPRGGVSKPLRASSSLERQAQEECGELFEEVEHHVLEARGALWTRNRRTVTLELTKASREVAKTRAELIAIRKRRDAAASVKIEVLIPEQQKSTIPGHE